MDAAGGMVPTCLTPISVSYDSHSVCRRAKMFRVINPFQVTKPVAPAEVIDRDDETAQLVSLAEEGNNARLVAPRRYGKTSLLRRVQDSLDRAGWITVYVDLLGIVTLDDFAQRVERAYSDALTGTVAKWFVGLRRSLRPALTVGGGPVPASATVDLGAERREALVARLALPTRVFEKTGRRVHVVFDEFQELDAVGGQADAVVRSEIQHHGDMASYVFAGSQLRMMEMLFADRKRAFYGQTERVLLQPLEAEPLAGYLASRFDRTRKDMTEAALGALLDLVEGHPQRAMAAAHALWNAADRIADLDEWEAARSSLMMAVEDELKTAWVELTATQRRVLLAVSLGSPPYQRSDGRSQGAAVTRALASLEGRGAITRVNGRWRVVDPLLAEWVRSGRPSA